MSSPHHVAFITALRTEFLCPNGTLKGSLALHSVQEANMLQKWHTAAKESCLFNYI